ncbi:diphosphomevalonate/mevalonate 3,5-bisphosphate decarboxylase family protein [Muriicola marianensis]|uniref:Diphosphomevalonate decarboxylase n=1 Tax=Muriicola marianensis TaxID=1324801 RepID=A0ABQ1QZR3_9FLAO|nr:diphosphomevalonate decarboxylase [Muriicola marianensis]GGD53087.1 diphosphomevalonate decarboxylase [Muriicola marianensis]
MHEKDFIPAEIEVMTDRGSASWRAPSNIALVKYWGKYEGQIPANPSLSFTLSASHTTTTTHFRKQSGTASFPTFDLLFEGKVKADFNPKVRSFFERIIPYSPWLKDFHLEINTENSFPHSSGIASSASSMAALSLCVLEMERLLYPSMTDDVFLRKASFLARLGSGSACRSVEGPLVSWGQHEKISAGSDLFGTVYRGSVHEVFRDYRDTILLVHKGQKTVSSTAGHSLMKDHHYAKQRFSQAHSNLSLLLDVLENGDLEGFARIVESEALSLHAMMMTSIPYYLLMKPNTLAIIEKIWEFRKETEESLCFTLDAGANVHLLYPANREDKVLQFIKNELVAYCQKGQYICDQSGQGAKKLESAV